MKVESNDGADNPHRKRFGESGVTVSVAVAFDFEEMAISQQGWFGKTSRVTSKAAKQCSPALLSCRNRMDGQQRTSMSSKTDRRRCANSVLGDVW
jgi:hypothetical protein